MPADDHGLTADELQAAQSFGMTPAEYAAYKEPAGNPSADFYRSASDHTIRKLDRAAEDTERERLKAAVREVLQEREAGS